MKTFIFFIIMYLAQKWDPIIIIIEINPSINKKHEVQTLLQNSTSQLFMPVDTSRTDKLISNSPITTAQNANLQISGRMKIPRHVFVTSHFLTCEGACE